MRWEQQEEPEDPAPDSYSRINPDSPWRWSAVICVPTFFLLPTLAVRFGLSPKQTGVLFSLNWIVLIPIVIMWFKVGSPIAWWVAAWKARKVGGVRINSHPHLVLAMRVIGPLMLFIGLGVIIVFHHPFQEHVMLATMGVFVTAWGWERPWDLRVVEGECARA